jgi:hypothetical protein
MRQLYTLTHKRRYWPIITLIVDISARGSAGGIRCEKATQNGDTGCLARTERECDNVANIIRSLMGGIIAHRSEIRRNENIERKRGYAMRYIGYSLKDNTAPKYEKATRDSNTERKCGNVAKSRTTTSSPWFQYIGDQNVNIAYRNAKATRNVVHELAVKRVRTKGVAQTNATENHSKRDRFAKALEVKCRHQVTTRGEPTQTSWRKYRWVRSIPTKTRKIPWPIKWPNFTM